MNQQARWISASLDMEAEADRLGRSSEFKYQFLSQASLGVSRTESR